MSILPSTRLASLTQSGVSQGEESEEQPVPEATIPTPATSMARPAIARMMATTGGGEGGR